MQNHEELTPAQQELESALGKLKPAPAALDRDQIMFQAGLRSARRARRTWQGIAAGLMLMLSVSLIYRSPAAPTTADAPGYIAQEQPQSGGNFIFTNNQNTDDQPGPIRSQASYFNMRSKVLAQGLESLPQENNPSGSDASTLTREYLIDLISSS